jgi:hypothetical protein
MKKASATLVLALLGTAAAGACGSPTKGTCDETATCPPEPDAGGVVVPADCDLAKSLKDSPGCVVDSVGIFVSASGNDGATGAKAAPVKSIGKGVELAASRGLPRVYVCEGTYDSAVEIKGAVSIHGGLSCAWAHTGAKPKLAPPKGVALKVTKASGAVLVEDLDVLGSADQGTPGDSAVAAFVSESANVTFRNTTLTAANGTPGSKGASRSNYTGTNATVGGTSAGAVAGAGASCTCVDGTTSKGGNGATGAGVGIQDGSSVPSVGATNAGSSSTVTCSDGTVGANGAAGGAGASVSLAGSLAADGWTLPSKPASAPNGSPAQGGGGGGAKTTPNIGGGGGACGGCGGAGGDAGNNGGSSFALLAFNSTVTVEGGALATGNAGKGGDGGDGQAGQGGGALGSGACNGGAGGSGAGGSGGSGGAGGHSVPVAYLGTEPRVTGATVTPGSKGTGGSGGGAGGSAGNSGTTGTPGPDGKTQNTLAL